MNWRRVGGMLGKTVSVKLQKDLNFRQMFLFDYNDNGK